MIFPLSHERMTVQRLPWITIGIILLNLIIFLVTWPEARRDQDQLIEVLEAFDELAEQHPGMAQEYFESKEGLEEYKALVARFEEVRTNSLFGEYGFVAARQEWADLLSSLFLHAGWMHLIGNMYLLWLCGCSIEDLWGRPVYIALYLAGGAAAALCHAVAFPASQAPLVGASGAIACLMGAFLIRLHNTRIRFFYFFWWLLFRWGTFPAPAWVVLPFWLLSQVFYAIVYSDYSPVAFWAHVGGFVFGAVAAIFIKLTLVEEAFLAPAIEEKTTLFKQHPKVKMAMDCMETGQFPEAIRHLQAALHGNPEDIDALHLLGQCYRAVGKPAEATAAYRRKILFHLKQREKDLATDTYMEMLEASPNVDLTPREVLSIGPALAENGFHSDAVELYRRLLEKDSEPLFRLKASLALADLYLQVDKTHLALEVLTSVAPLAESSPDWKDYLQQKIDAVRRAGAPAAPQS